MSASYSKGQVVQILSALSTDSNLDSKFVGVEFDSRRVEPGNLFVALKAEAGGRHGHQFLKQAFDAGAVLALVEDRSLLESSDYKDKLILVSNSLEGFHKLASEWRAQLGTRIIAVTGSLGKTFTKSVCAHLLTVNSKGTSSEKSFNNHIGVPYTICQISKDNTWAVLEMGMNHSGELSELSKLAKPDLALITCVAPVHMEFFDSLGQIADAKLEIVDGLSEDGVLILNSDQDFVVKKSQWKNIRFFGKGSDAEIRIVRVDSVGMEPLIFVIDHEGNEYRIKTKIIGSHNAMNIAAAILAVRNLFPEISVNSIVQALEEFKAPSMRLNLFELGDGKILIDDTYNASPEAMKAAIGLVLPKTKDKKVALVLGQMNELGDSSKEYHLEIGKFLAKADFYSVTTLGEAAKYYAEFLQSSKTKVVICDRIEEVISSIQGMDFDLILVKGSRSLGLDRLVKELRN